MPKEPRCSICTDLAARTAVAKLSEEGASQRHIADRLKLAKSSVDRHLKHAIISGRHRSRAGRPKSPQAGRATAGRCDKCGTLLDDPKPEALIKRAERVLAFGETIMQKALDDDDFRLALQAVDRARQSLDQLLKVHGLLQPEGGVTVNVAIDNRKKLDAWFSSLTEDQLLHLEHMISAGVDVPALATDNRELSGPSRHVVAES
ncbi:MAG TPA: hypothetical protein VGI19_02755 [Candidatus Cybelea sp.]